MTQNPAVQYNTPQPLRAAADKPMRDDTIHILPPRYPPSRPMAADHNIIQISDPGAEGGSPQKPSAAAAAAAAAATTASGPGTETAAGPAAEAATAATAGAVAQRRSVPRDSDDSSGSPRPPQHGAAHAPRPHLQNLKRPVVRTQNVDDEDGDEDDDDDDGNVDEDADNATAKDRSGAVENTPLRCYRCNEAIASLKHRNLPGVEVRNIRMCSEIACFKPIKRVLGSAKAEHRLRTFEQFLKYYQDRLDKYIANEDLIGARGAGGKEDIIVCQRALDCGAPLPPPPKYTESFLRSRKAWKGAPGSGNVGDADDDDDAESESEPEGSERDNEASEGAREAIEAHSIEASDAEAAGADSRKIAKFTHLRTILRTGEESYRVQFDGQASSAPRFWTRSDLGISKAAWDAHVAGYRATPRYKRSLAFKNRNEARRGQNHNKRAAVGPLEDSRDSDAWDEDDDASAEAAGPSRKRTRTSSPGGTGADLERPADRSPAAAPASNPGRVTDRPHADAARFPSHTAPAQHVAEEARAGVGSVGQEARQVPREAAARAGAGHAATAAVAAAAAATSAAVSQQVRANVQDRLSRARKRMQKGARERAVTLLKDLTAFIESERGGGIEAGAASRLRDSVAQIINDVREGDEDAIDEVEELLAQL